jgi:hypothetical protein
VTCVAWSNQWYGLIGNDGPCYDTSVAIAHRIRKAFELVWLVFVRKLLDRWKRVAHQVMVFSQQVILSCGCHDSTFYHKGGTAGCATRLRFLSPPARTGQPTHLF